MRRWIGCWAVVAFVVGSSGVSGQTVRSYTVLSRNSTLVETGGFAGVSNTYRVSGSFDLTTSSSSWLGGTAKFSTAELWGALISDKPSIAANDPTPSIVIDVDDTLNLEELVGVGLPVAGPYDAYRFTGFLGNSDAASPLEHGSSIQLLGIVFGPWIYVRGGTLAPAGSADFFDYNLRMVARTGDWADANGDGVVNAADYTAIRDGMGGGPAAVSAGSDDPLALWAAQYGQSIPSTATFDAMLATASSGATAIPEPATLALVLLAVAPWASRGRAS
ncbi:MAG: hypothetical protein ACRCT8_06310 [Lacipirellulaceae bacterium]